MTPKSGISHISAKTQRNSNTDDTKVPPDLFGKYYVPQITLALLPREQHKLPKASLQRPAKEPSYVSQPFSL
jgi:hypothetical protein